MNELSTQVYNLLVCTTPHLMRMPDHQTKHPRRHHPRHQQAQPRLLPKRLALGLIVFALVGVLMCAVCVRVGERGDDGRDVEE
jgi:hypothetical protein